MNDTLDLFAPVPRGMEALLAEELAGLGAGAIRRQRAGVAFAGDLEMAYRACLWSRLASRVLLGVGEFSAPDEQAVYEGVRGIDWSRHLAASGTLRADFTTQDAHFANTHFAALRVKDAIADQFRAASGQRPSVDKDDPDLRVRVHVAQGRGMAYVDLSGAALHRRGWRQEQGAAPMKENLAAAVLLLAGWRELARAGAPFVDPVCGAGTLPIEAALIAHDIAPGLLRGEFGFMRWRGHAGALWQRLHAEALQRREIGLQREFDIAGYDRDAAAVARARLNAQAAGLADHVRFAVRGIDAVEAAALGQSRGLLAANPPYGERLSDPAELAALYRALLHALEQRYRGWRAVLLSAWPGAGQVLGAAGRAAHRLYNGALACTLWSLDARPLRAAPRPAAAVSVPAAGEASMAQAFAARLAKRFRHLRRWAARVGTDSFRVYDRDLPDYALAIDWYAGWLHVQEYAAPAEIDPERAAARLAAAVDAAVHTLDIDRQRISVKERSRRGPETQYGRLAQRGEFLEVHEGDARYRVNLWDYLDTGLFLEQRAAREWIRGHVEGKRFLNLFAYTATATVSAGLGGAHGTVSVDLSRTYLDWAERNLLLNGFSGERHALIQADCMQWLAQARERFDLIYLNPPVWSASARMQGDFDLVRDHAGLLRAALGLLAPSGELLFLTHKRGFALDTSALAGWLVQDLGTRLVPEDFERRAGDYRAWLLRRDADL